MTSYISPEFEQANSSTSEGIPAPLLAGSLFVIGVVVLFMLALNAIPMMYKRREELRKQDVNERGMCGLMLLSIHSE